MEDRCPTCDRPYKDEKKQVLHESHRPYKPPAEVPYTPAPEKARAIIEQITKGAEPVPSEEDLCP